MAVKKTKIVDPKTGARIADPEFSGMALSQGATGTNWPEVRNQYKKGLRNAEFNRPGVPAELKSYLTGKTNKLSEEFSDPFVKPGGSVEYHRLSKTANLSEFDDTPKTEKMAKMPTKKAKITVPKGKLRGTVKEEYAFEPATRGTKDKTKTSAAMTSGLTRAKNPSGSLGAARVTSTEKKGQLGYNREKTLFEAKAGTSVSGRDFSNMSAADIKSKKQEIKQDRRDYRKSSVEGKNVGIKEATMDIRQARKAETYTRKAEAGNLNSFTPGYKKGESKQGSNRIEAFKNSSDNAANRNTMQSKLKAVSSKTTNKTSMY
jgi:hypothetical protein